MQFTSRCSGEPCSSSGVTSRYTCPAAISAFTLAPIAVNACPVSTCSTYPIAVVQRSASVAARRGSPDVSPPSYRLPPLGEDEPAPPPGQYAAAPPSASAAVNVAADAAGPTEAAAVVGREKENVDDLEDDDVDAPPRTPPRAPRLPPLARPPRDGRIDRLFPLPPPARADRGRRAASASASPNRRRPDG
eukprot:31016-Pelagococcus_subviridis.AAC.1